MSSALLQVKVANFSFKDLLEANVCKEDVQIIICKSKMRNIKLKNVLEKEEEKMRKIMGKIKTISDEIQKNNEDIKNRTLQLKNIRKLKGDNCKKKWKSLGDAFQKAARNNKTKSGQAASGSKKWKYWDSMSPVEKTYNKDDANVVQEENETMNTQSQSQLDDNSEDDENITSPSTSFSRPNSPLSCSSNVVNTPRSNTTNEKRVPVPKKSNTSRKAESLPEILKEYVNEKKRSRLEKQSLSLAHPTEQKNEALFEFFKSMAKTTSSFPPLWQAKVKSRVFEIVNCYELALLEKSSTSLDSPTTMPANISFQNQPPTPSSSFLYNVPPNSSQGAPATDFYSTFASGLGEKDSGQNNLLTMN